jgi:hypothetical protein
MAKHNVEGSTPESHGDIPPAALSGSNSAGRIEIQSGRIGKLARTIYEWIVSKTIIENINDARSNDKVLWAYYQLILKILFPMVLISVFFIALTALSIEIPAAPQWIVDLIPKRVKESVQHISQWIADWTANLPRISLKTNLSLDGQTLANYVALIFSTVVALAGSLVAIILALKSQATSEATQDLELQNKEREDTKHARENQEYVNQIKKEFSNFYLCVTDLQSTIRSKYNLAEIDRYYAALYLSRWRAWKLSDFEIDGFQNAHDEPEHPFDPLRSIESYQISGPPITAKLLIADSLKQSFGIVNNENTESSVNSEIRDIDGRYRYIFKVNRMLAGFDVVSQRTPLKQYINSASLFQSLGTLKGDYKRALSLTSRILDITISHGHIDRLLPAGSEFKNNALKLKTIVRNVANLPFDDEEFLRRYCIARLLSTLILKKTSSIGDWLVFIFLPIGEEWEIYKHEDELIYIDTLSEILSEIGKDENLDILFSENHLLSQYRGITKKDFLDLHIPSTYIEFSKEIRTMATFAKEFYKKRMFSDEGSWTRVNNGKDGDDFMKIICQLGLYHPKSVVAATVQ